MSNNLLISYDLISPGQHYEAVVEKIKELGGWAKVEYSFWYVNSTYTAAQARDHIKTVLDANDKLFVVDASNGTAAWHGLTDPVSTYIRDNWSK